MTVDNEELDDILLRAAVQVAQIDRTISDYKKKLAGRKPFATTAAIHAAREAALGAEATE